MTILLPITGTVIAALSDQIAAIDPTFRILCEALSARYVRREQRFYNVTRPGEALSRRDMEQAFINQVQAITLQLLTS